MQKVTFCFFFFCLAGALGVVAQNGTPPSGGARGVALGNATVTFNDVQAAFSNQAGLAFIDNTSFTLFGESRFVLSEIKSVSAAAALPTQSGTFGLSLNYFGYESYNEQRIGLAYARQLLEKLSLGVQIDVINTTIPTYGNRALFSFEIGLHYEFLDGLTLGVHAFSPVRVEVVENENLPTLLKLGLSYVPSDKVTFFLEAEKDIEYPMLVKIGLEYLLAESLFLRGGININPTLFGFGLGYLVNDNLSIDVGAGFHQTIGVSPAFSLNYKL